MSSLAQKNRCAFLLSVYIFSLFVIATGQVLDVQPSQLTVLENEEAQILCRYGQPLHYCRISIPGVDNALVLSHEWNKHDGYTYYGAGTDQGQCGVTIKHVKAKNHGIVKCYIGTKGEELVGQVPLTVALAPLQPELQIVSGSRQGSFEIDQNVELKCISRDGRPASKLSWFLDGEPLYETLGHEEIIESLASNNQTLYTSTQTLTRHIRAGDDHKTVTCRATHAGKTQDTNLQLQVKYQPQPQPETIVFGVIQGQTAIINMSINANPRPRTEWSVDGLTIPEGGQNGRFEASEPVDLGNGVYNVSLAIGALSLEDTTKEYILSAYNQFGTEKYSLRISSSEPTSAVGLDVGSIVGIALGGAVLVLIVALVVVARLTGKWCFAGASLNTDIGPDSEAQITPQHDDFDQEQTDNEQEHQPHSDLDEKTNGSINGQNTKQEKTNTPV